MRYNQTYLYRLNQTRQTNKFNTIYQSLMYDLDLMPNIQCNYKFKNQNVNVLLEQINTPQYVICQSGQSLLLQDVLFWTNQQLITEGILQQVVNKVKQICQKIKEGIMNVIKQSSDKIKAFCQKVKENKIVISIRKKLKLDQKLSMDKFKGFFKVNKNQKLAKESRITDEYGFIISEATKLNKKQEALTDQKQINKEIQKWQKKLESAKGNKGKQKYYKEKINLFKKKLHNSSQTSSISTKKSSDKKKSKSSKPQLGQLHVQTDGIKKYVQNITVQSTDDNNMKIMDKDVAISIGGDKAQKVITGNGQSESSKVQSKTQSEHPKEQKKGFFSKIKDTKNKLVGKAIQKSGISKVIQKGKQIADKTGITKAVNKANQKANQLGNKAKQKIQNLAGKIKQWYNKQNVWVKWLIKIIIAILVILALYFIITSFIMPILYGIMHGGVVNGAVGIFRIYASGKTFITTYKAGQKAWQSGQSWGKFFLLLIGSVLAFLNLKQMADQGSAMMAADEAKSAATSSTSQLKAKVTTGESDVSDLSDPINSNNITHYTFQGEELPVQLYPKNIASQILSNENLPSPADFADDTGSPVWDEYIYKLFKTSQYKELYKNIPVDIREEYKDNLIMQLQNILIKN